jgi:hypothetical protein
MEPRSFPAHVRHDNGQLQLADREAFVSYIKSLPPGTRLTLTVAAEQDVRSLAQNARFWKICELAAEAWSVGRPLPLHKDQAKLVLCRVFLGTDDTPLGPVPKGTRGLSIEAMAKLMTEIEEYFRSQGQALPLDRCD